MRRPFLLGIGGGSAVGKTTFALRMKALLGEDHVSHVQHDWYYRDLGHLDVSEHGKINFDSPDAIDNEEAIRDLTLLRDNKPITAPAYNFISHERTPNANAVSPTRVVIVEGLFVLAVPGIRKLLDLRAYIDASPDIRLQRKVNRDVEERGRTHAQAFDHYTDSVMPAHQAIVEPAKREHADLIIPTNSVHRIEKVLRALLATRP